MLLKTLKSTLGSRYSVSVAIGAGKWRSDQSYDIPEIFDSVDFVNLMTYDLHGSWESKTGNHVALYKSADDNTSSNVDDSVKFLINHGVDRSKIILGIAAYGVGFQLSNCNNNGVGSSASAGSKKKYNEIQPFVNSGYYNYRWDSQQKVPYVFSGTEWIGYEDVKSVTYQANYIKDKNLGGAMFWSIDGDDYNNSCGFGRFPLISTVNNILN